MTSLTKELEKFGFQKVEGDTSLIFEKLKIKKNARRHLLTYSVPLETRKQFQQADLYQVLDDLFLQTPEHQNHSQWMLTIGANFHEMFEKKINSMKK